MRIALIDIGSNTIRLVVYDGDKEIENTADHAGLVAEVSEGKITPAGISKLTTALVSMKKRAIELGSEKIYAFATASLRDIEDKEGLISFIEETSGIKIEIISGESEAMYDYVVNRDYDLGLVAVNGYRSQIAVVPFFSMDMSVVINCSEQFGASITSPSQLDPAQEIYMEYGSQIRAWRNKWWTNAVPQTSIDSFQLLEEYLSIPGKWALIPTGILNRLPSNSSLYRCRFGDNDVPKRTCYYIYHQQAGFYETKECTALLDCMRQQISADPTLTLL